MKCDSLILGNIIPLDIDLAHAEAMAVKDGHIIYVGTKEVAKKLCGKQTKIYDYGKNYIYPGFFDSHCHGTGAGQRLMFQCDLTGRKSLEEYPERIKAYIKANPKRKYYLGSGWEKFGTPNAAMLDAVCKDKPIVLTSVDGHSMWVNTKAMEVAGYTPEKCKELGYEIARVDENGNPTGYLSEKATLIFLNKFSTTREELKEGILAWQEFAFSHGMTSVVDAQADQYIESLEAYNELAKEGKLKLRTFGYPTHRLLYGKGADAVANEIIKDSKKYNDEYFKVIGCKLFVDGVVEAGTAYLSKPYKNKKGYYGVFNFKGRENMFKDIVKKVNAAGLACHFHAIGDEAVKTAIDYIEESEYENCNFDVRNNIAHLQLVRPSDIKRCSELNIGAIVAPLWVPNQTPYFEGECEYLGIDRAYSAYPIKSFVDAGATIGFHTDYPITPVVDIPLELYEAVKRGDPKLGPKSVKNPDESIDMLKALLALTADAAYLVKEENNLGTLSIGKIANCVVFTKNFLECDINEVPNAKLVATLVDGKPVYTKK